MITRTISPRTALLAVLLGGLGLLAPNAHAGFWRSLGRQVYATMRAELGATFASIPDRDGALWRDMYFTFEEEHERFFDEFRDAHDADDFASLEGGEAAYYSAYHDAYSFWSVPLERAEVTGEGEGFEQADAPAGSTNPDADTRSTAEVASADGSQDDGAAGACTEVDTGQLFGLGGASEGGVCTEDEAPAIDAPSAQDFTALLAGGQEFSGVEFEILIPASGAPMLAPVAAERAFSSPTWRLVRLASGITVSVPGYAYPSRVAVDPPSYEGEERQWTRIEFWGWTGVFPRGEPNADPEDEWVVRWVTDEPVSIALPRSVVEYAEAMIAGPPAPEEERPVRDEIVATMHESITVTAQEWKGGEDPTDEVTLGRTYVLQDGDTLGDIAIQVARLLGEGAPAVWGPTGVVATLAAVNGDSIEDADRIYAGDLLYIPDAEVFADEIRLQLFGGSPGAAD